MGSFGNLMLNGVLIAVVAHGLVGISLVWDKILLKRKGTRDLSFYVFWLGAISIFGLILIPFGFRWPSLKIALLALTAGFCDLAATWAYYAALKNGEASEEMAATGGFTPLATARLGTRVVRLRNHLRAATSRRHNHRQCQLDSDCFPHTNL